MFVKPTYLILITTIFLLFTITHSAFSTPLMIEEKDEFL